MPQVVARQRIQDRAEAEAITIRPRKGLGQTSKRRGETEAALATLHAAFIGCLLARLLYAPSRTSFSLLHDP